MCMDEFVKRLYDFWVFIEFFGVKIVITDIYRYFTDIYRYFTDIYRYFFRNSCTSARAPQS